MKKIKIILKKQNVQTNEIYEEIVKFDEDILQLDLSNQNIIEIPKGLEQLKFLKELYLYNNKISKIENLDKNVNLEYLHLYNNKITKIENVHHLEKLQNLYVFAKYQSEKIKETKQISLSNKEIELKEIQIQEEIKEELLKQEKQRQEKEYFDNNFEQIKQQFISSNISNVNELII